MGTVSQERPQEDNMSWWLMHEKNRKDAKLQEIRSFFRSVDKDDDDEITKEDWYKALSATGAKVTMEDVEKMFAELDKDFDGKLLWREFIGEETTTERAFKLFDEDHDGKISKSEFQRFCHKLSRDQVDAAFAKFDTSGDGKLNYREFCELMHSKQILNSSCC